MENVSSRRPTLGPKALYHPAMLTMSPHMQRVYDDARGRVLTFDPFGSIYKIMPSAGWCNTDLGARMMQCFAQEPPQELSLFEARFLPIMRWLVEMERVDRRSMERFSAASTHFVFTARCLLELGHTHVSWRFLVFQIHALAPNDRFLREFFAVHIDLNTKIPVRFATRSPPNTPLLDRIFVASDDAPFSRWVWHCYTFHLNAILQIEWTDGQASQERYVGHLEAWGRATRRMPRVTAEMTSRMLQTYVPHDVQDPVLAMKLVSSSRRKLRREQKEDLPPPDDFMCPIHLELMQDPVCTPCGHVFERDAIERVAAQQHHVPEGLWRCPVCRAWLWPGAVREDVSLRRLIRWWKRGR